MFQDDWFDYQGIQDSAAPTTFTLIVPDPRTQFALLFTNFTSGWRASLTVSSPQTSLNTLGDSNYVCDSRSPLYYQYLLMTDSAVQSYCNTISQHSDCQIPIILETSHGRQGFECASQIA